jgi:hypothetical protein
MARLTDFHRQQSALFSAVPPDPPPLPHAFSPEEVTQMLLEHDAAIREIHEELALLRELLRGGLPPLCASLPTSSAAALPTLSTGPFTVETAEKMLTRQVSATVRLQAAARGLLARRRVGRLLALQLIQPRTLSQFLQAVRHCAKAATTTAQHQAVLRLQVAAHTFLARRRLQKAHNQLRDREAALAAVAFDAEGCDLDSLDGQLCRSADVSKGAHGVFPVDGVLQLCGDGGRGGVFLLVASGDALPSASAFHLRPPQGRLHWSSSRLLLGGCAPTPLSFRWSPWDPGGRTHATWSCESCLPSGSCTIKSRSLFQIKNNQISRDVKGLF